MLGARPPPLAPAPQQAERSSPEPSILSHASRKRRRPALSCERCRRRKVKCDREDPCGPCSNGGNASLCHYEPLHHQSTPVSALRSMRFAPAATSPQEAHPRSNTRQFDTAESGSHSATASPGAPDRNKETGNAFTDQTAQGLQDRISRIEHLLSSDDTSHPMPQTKPTSNPATAQPDIGYLNSRLQRIEQLLQVQPSPRADDLSPSSLSVPAAAPRVRVDKKKTRFLGSSHYRNSMEQEFHLFHRMMAKTKSSGPSDAVASEVMASVENCRTLRKRVKQHHYVKAEDPFPAVMDSLPPRETSDRLVSSYLRTFELIYRVVHIPSFWKQYRQYWEHPQGASAGFKMKLLLILALGCSVEGDEDVVTSVRSYISQWVFTAQWWLTGPTERSTAGLEGLQVYCLLVLSRQAHSIGNSGSNWTLSGSLLHFACMQGLHRDPMHFPELSFLEAETRRRLWATVSELLLQTSIDAYMSPMLCLDDFDCDPPSNLDDEDFNDQTSAPPPSKPHKKFTQTSIQLLLHQSIRSRLSTLRFLNSLETHQSYDTALRLGSELRNACQRSEMFFHSCSSGGDYSFHKKLSDMILWRPILLLHSPFLLRGAADPRFHFSRKVGLESAMVLLSHLGNLDASSGMVDEFDRLTCMSTGTFKGAISLDAITTVCLEILTQLYEEGLNRGPEHGANAVVVNMTRASRTLLIQTLEHVRKQLEHLVARGDPSLKRYVFLNTTLAQIHALETGTAPEPLVRKVLKESLQSCQNMLQNYIDTAQLPEYSPYNLVNMDNDDSLYSSLVADPVFNFEFDPSKLLSLWDDPNVYNTHGT